MMINNINKHGCTENQNVYPLRGKMDFIYGDLQYFIPACGWQALRGKFSVGDSVL